MGQINSFYASLNACTRVILRMLPQYAKTFRLLKLEEKFPKILKELFDLDAKNLKHLEMLDKCESNFDTINVTKLQI